MDNTMQTFSPPGKQRGAAIVEAAIVLPILILLLFGAIEGGRLMYTWNAVAEATRLGARAAAVCPVNSNIIKNIARFNNGGVLPSNLTNANVQVKYLDNTGAATVTYNNIAFVEVRIVNYTHDFLVPGFSPITLPPFTSVRARESLGVLPDGTTTSC